MFQIRRRQRVDHGSSPDAMEWWKRSFQRYDPTEQIAQLRRRLRSAIARVEGGERPVLRALGRDFDAELKQLAGQTAIRPGESASTLRRRCELLGEMVDYYCDAVTPCSRASDAVELLDCAREAVAGLSADMLLVLRVEGEPIVVAGRRQLISLFEVAIRSAATRPEYEVEIRLLPCQQSHAEVHLTWPKALVVPRDGHDKARFLILATAYSLKLRGTLTRSTGPTEKLVIRIPLTAPA